MRIFGLTIMKTTTYSAKIRESFDVALAVSRISARLDVPPVMPTQRRRRRGGHLRLVTDSLEPELGLLWVAPRDTA